MQRAISVLGFCAMLLMAWCMSSSRRRISGRILIGGTLLQIGLACLILKTEAGGLVFAVIGDFFRGVMTSVDAGCAVVFDVYPREGDSESFPPQDVLWRSLAFGILPTIVFFSSFMAVLYHFGIMQLVVRILSWVMQKTLGTSGAETLSAVANIFVGSTEAPLMVRPYVGRMTLSELNVVMVSGFATIAGGVMAMYARMGIDPGHLMTASVISAPAALMIAKIMQPETETPETTGRIDIQDERSCVNVLEAAAEGTTTGLKLALNVGAMLIVFTAFVAMTDALLAAAGSLVATWFDYPSAKTWSLQLLFGYVFAPIAWLMGIPWHECRISGGFLGTKMILNEMLAYRDLLQAQADISPRSFIILTYALCGFANFGSIGIQLAGLGSIAPDRRSDLARLSFRAMLGGALAGFMTACVASALLSDADIISAAGPMAP